ncbi:hypothetical protein EVAR_61816_1 [Eumeta japonica]|uniref:Uncharacterized protein n=1 Tax=Eumeta variegata TaxID=151549 RepID=A0A4C1YSD0_EUMVA|nr:hypothetical protein EVAR_61816_1 [Eumeta japonica]
MWRRVAMHKRLCDSLLTRFDGAVYYGIHFDYMYIPLYSVATRRHGKRRHTNNPVYPASIDVSRQKNSLATLSKTRRNPGVEALRRAGPYGAGAARPHRTPHRYKILTIAHRSIYGPKILNVFRDS